MTSRTTNDRHRGMAVHQVPGCGVLRVRGGAHGRRVLGIGAAFVLLSLSSVVLADGPRVRATPTNSGGGGAGVVELEDPNSPAAQARRERGKARVANERDLKRHRAKYFRGIRNVEIRQVGIDGLREYADPSAFPIMLEIFGGEGEDVVGGLLDHLMELETEEADTTVGWAAVFGETQDLRDAAMDRLAHKYRGDVAASEDVPTRLQSVVAVGLRRTQPNVVVNRAAKLADVLGLVQAIPMLIQAQAQGNTSRVGSRSDTGQLGWIFIGQQTAFIADLEPVVGDSAVAFDPTIGVVTDGAVLQISGAVVITYRVEVNAALNRLASAAWGHRTEYLGWNQLAWRRWYNDEFAPYWTEILEQRRLDDADAAAGDNFTTSTATTTVTKGGSASAPGAERDRDTEHREPVPAGSHDASRGGEG